MTLRSWIIVTAMSFLHLVHCDFTIYSWNGYVQNQEPFQSVLIVDSPTTPDCDHLMALNTYRPTDDVNRDDESVRWTTESDDWGSENTINVLEFRVKAIGHYTWYKSRNSALVDAHDVQVGTCTTKSDKSEMECGVHGVCQYPESRSAIATAILECTTPLTPDHAVNTGNMESPGTVPGENGNRFIVAGVLGGF